jgi:adenosylcobinamide kinase/adenosylcobinamide-phosphate guanylyltransferase
MGVHGILSSAKGLLLPAGLQALPLWQKQHSIMMYFVTGGTRSGKSRYAMRLAEQLSEKPIYIATARRWDDDFESRIKRHEKDRGPQWQTIEKETKLYELNLGNAVAVVDCVTLWLANYFVDFEQDIDRCLSAFEAEMEQLSLGDATLIIISNELGMGMHAETEAGRKFTDLQGWANQKVAGMADHVTCMISGLPLVVKP